MGKESLQVALAGLINETGIAPGWQAEIAERIKDPISKYGGMIKVAAQLASGTLKPGTAPSNLKNILASILVDEKQTKTDSSQYFRPGSLSLHEDVIFPADGKNGGNQDVIQQIVNDIKDSLPKNYREDEGYVEAVLSVLHRTTFNLPSAYVQDVSYYDHQRMTAALAVCLYKKNNQDVLDYINNFEKYKAEPVALLIGGDISGIQDFIYTITAKGAAKSLRGRSFYLQLLTEAVLRYVLREMDIPYTNVIYSGGGHFFLLAPLSAAGKLEAAQRKITEALWKHHGSSLYLALGYSEVPVEGFFEKNFPVYWGKMHGALAHRKQKRYSELGSDFHEQIFKPATIGGNPDDACSACKEDHRKTKEWSELDIQERICSLCESFIEDFGKKLPRNRFISLEFGPSKSSSIGTASDALAEFGMTFKFHADLQDAPSLNNDHVVLWSLDDLEKVEVTAMKDLPKWIRYTAHQVPQDKHGEMYAFDDLQGLVSGGFERLGVLRMDVDNLGELFKTGLGKDATLTRLASLSFRISLFFEGWLKKLCDDEKYKGLIYTVYSGGDDVFLIGPWDLMPDLARHITDDFARYTSKNPAVHLSAGMAFIDGKYPVYQAAEDAKNAIDDAKDINGKNAFTFLDESWKWDIFNEINVKQGQLSQLIKPSEVDRKPAPQGLLHVLQDLALEEQRYEKPKGLHVWGRWIWMGMYQLTRMAEQNKSNSDAIKAIRDSLTANNYKEIHQWGVAARWTQLKERKKS